MSDVVALVQVDEFQIIEGETYSSDDPRVQRNPQWFAGAGEVVDEIPAPEQVEIERTEEPEAEPEPEG